MQTGFAANLIERLLHFAKQQSALWNERKNLWAKVSIKLRETSAFLTVNFPLTQHRSV
ncbi:hypothetical protein Z949_1166 [Sulfitobacter guttiformis KCTC 32187]|nr:hypothetical protein Z949_1166 [Sulfitobacter guttiformis KCTC 32187]